MPHVYVVPPKASCKIVEFIGLNRRKGEYIV